MSPPILYMSPPILKIAPPIQFEINASTRTSGFSRSQPSNTDAELNATCDFWYVTYGRMCDIINATCHIKNAICLWKNGRSAFEKG